MLTKGATSDGRSYHRMPFRKALKRDDWNPSAEAKLVASQWKNIQRAGGKTSFNSSDQ